MTMGFIGRVENRHLQPDKSSVSSTLRSHADGVGAEKSTRHEKQQPICSTLSFENRAWLNLFTVFAIYDSSGCADALKNKKTSRLGFIGT